MKGRNGAKIAVDDKPERKMSMVALYYSVQIKH